MKWENNKEFNFLTTLVKNNHTQLPDKFFISSSYSMGAT